MTVFHSPEEIIRDVGNAAEELGIAVHAVGGYVRDKLLGHPFRGEVDFSVLGNAPEFAKFLAKRWHLTGKVTVYRRFGTAALSISGITLEFASCRKESYHPESRNPDVKPAAFEEDIARRDFTVNALAINTREPDTIIDLHNGQEDLKNGIIRTPLEPKRTFSDDPLRILRAIRFAARLGFTIEETTWKALKSESKRLTIVARERINDEFFKILGHTPPSFGLNLLYDSGVLEVIFPEIAALAGVEQIGKHHHKDVFLHSLKVLDKVAEQTARVDLRFAALVHDIGKPRTKRFEKGHGWTFHSHEFVGAKVLRKMGKKYKLSDELTDFSSHLINLHMRPINLQDEGVSDSAIRRLMVQAGEEIDDLLMLCRADITSGNEKKVRRYLRDFEKMVERMGEIEQKDTLRAFQSPIRGDELMERFNLPEGPRVGLIKAFIEEAILEGDIPFSREGAEEYLPEVMEKVSKLEDKDVLLQLRSIMRARAEGTAPDFLA